MSLETRSNSALMKRAEQLKRWQDSETFREPGDLKRKKRRIGFSDGCVFLAACAAGDKEEVKNLISRGTDIDTANVDGLTALHQVENQSGEACKDQGHYTECTYYWENYESYFWPVRCNEVTIPSVSTRLIEISKYSAKRRTWFNHLLLRAPDLLLSPDVWGQSVQRRL